MGLAWQQGPLAAGSIGHFLVPDPLPERLLFAEPLRRRMRVRFGDEWIADSENAILLHEPGRYPVAYFPKADITPLALEPSERVSEHRDLGATRWYRVRGGGRVADRGAWEHIDLPDHAGELRDRVAFAWRAMDAFYEEDERVVGHAADAYHRIDIRQASRRLVVRSGDDIGGVHRAAWSYRDAYAEVGRVSDLISFEPDRVTVELDGQQLHLEPGQTVIPHGVDRDLTVEELGPATVAA
jgi:uncharacterized protein (DUF427 family)